MASASIGVTFTILLLALGLFFTRPEAATPAFFVFGDSLVDCGNNNYLATTARANAPPYGIDYPSHRATGRFSNGYNIPDLISLLIASQSIGSEATLPYLSPELSGQKLLISANFASAGIGILNDTGIQFVNIVRAPVQLDYFKQYQDRVSALIGQEKTRQLVNTALVLVTLGGNDFVNNYYLVPYSVRSRQYSLQDYVPFIVSEYKKLLSKLYDLGARRVLVTGTGSLGCVPAELAQHSRNGECESELQRAASLFNSQLDYMLIGLNEELGSHVFVGVNTRKMHNDFLSNPGAYGFVTAKIACCGQGPYNGIGVCTPLSKICLNRDVYAFWDAFHPSEKANRLIVDQIMTGTTEYMKPMNLSTILALDAN
ncbi:GDSL esterase/lipase LTL1-like [Bidens hawaiensis]|uniref:GDSL esterase/lipase LTL1-like n=1 Tax=Bidens hawaiensis TaxID=980011 RepID=UPI00404921FC